MVRQYFYFIKSTGAFAVGKINEKRDGSINNFHLHSIFKLSSHCFGPSSTAYILNQDFYSAIEPDSLR